MEGAVQIDPRNKCAFAKLLLAHALRLNPDGVVDISFE